MRDDRGASHDGDLVLLCPGAAHGGLTREVAGELPVRRVRLQMMQTEPLGEALTTAIADGDSFRYYPGYAGSALNELRDNEPQDPVADANQMQLLCVQRLHGGLTIGDTHEYTEPFGFDVHEPPYEYLIGLVEELLGRPLPPVRQRWAGVYSQCTDPGRTGVPARDRARRLGDHRTRWSRDDAGSGDRRAHRGTDRHLSGNLRNMMADNPIQLAVIDMAGTTVADDGLVVEAFEAAATAAGLPHSGAEREQARRYVLDTMGQSKIAVFRALFGQEELAQQANRAFEAAYDELIDNGNARPIPGAAEAITNLRSAGVKVALTTGFSATTQDKLLAALGWQSLADLTLGPR